MHLYIRQNQFRLKNMFSTRVQLLGMGLPVARNLGRSCLSKSTVARKLACSYFSVKVDVEGEIIPPIRGNKNPLPQKFIEKVTNVDHATHRPAPVNIRRPIQDERTSIALLHRLKTLTKSTVRDPWTLQSICTMLLNSDLDLNVKDSIDLLYCLSVLNVHDEKLLTKLLTVINDLLSEIYKPSPLILCISKSMRNLQIRHTAVLNGLINWFMVREQSMELVEAADLIQTLALLNYFPANGDILLKQMLNYDMVEYTSSMNYLNFVWAITLIDRIKPEMAESVMVTSFRKKLESILAPGIRNGAYLKLINIHAHANLRKFKIKMDSSWYSTENTLLNNIKEKRLKDSAIRNFIDCLANVMPNRTFNTFVETESGCVIDAVCFFDNDHKPITELEFVKKKNGIKLAILFLLYKDLCLPGKTVANGIVEFHKRFLESSDYNVLYVPFNEFPAQDSLRKKSAYIKRKIQSVLPKYGNNG